MSGADLEGFPPELRDHFRPRRELGRGGMGRVYLVDELGLDRPVALKLVETRGDASLEARVQREAEALARVQHPNVLRLLRHGRYGQGFFLATEVVEGRDLVEAPPQGDPVEPLLSIAEALEAAHAAGLVHRDVKPENVLLEASGRPVLVDFGLVLDADAQRLTRTGQVVGTTGYMSPEAMRGQPVGPAADWWGWGATLFYLLEGRPPLTRVDQMLLLRGQPPEPLSFTRTPAQDPRARLAAACLALDPEVRPAGRAGLEDAWRRARAGALAAPAGGGAAGTLIQGGARSESGPRFASSRVASGAASGAAASGAAASGAAAATLRSRAPSGSSSQAPASRRAPTSPAALALRAGLVAALVGGGAWWALGGRPGPGPGGAGEGPVLGDGGGRPVASPGGEAEEGGPSDGAPLAPDEPAGPVATSGAVRVHVGALDDPRYATISGAGLDPILGIALVEGFGFLDLDPEGQHLAYPGPGAMATLLDADTLEVVALLDGHPGRLRTVEFSPDGGRLAAGGWGGTLRIWDLAAGSFLDADVGEAAVHDVAWVPGGELVLAACGDGWIRVVQGASGRLLGAVARHQDAVLNLAVVPGGRVLISSSYDDTLRAWDLATGRELWKVDEDSVGSCMGTCVSPDGAWIATGHRDGAVRTWDVGTGEVRTVSEGHTENAVSMAFDLEGGRLWSASWDGTLGLWDLATGQALGRTAPEPEWIKGLARGPEGRVYAVTRSGEVMAREGEGGRVLLRQRLGSDAGALRRRWAEGADG